VKRSARHQHCIEPAETALGYDREAGYGIGDTAHARTGTCTSAWRRTLRVLMGEKRTTTTSKKSTAEAALGYDQAVSYGIETHSARTDRTHARAPRSGGHHAFLWEKRSARHNTASKHRREAALGYDHEAVSYGIGDAQRTHGQGTRTGATQQRTLRVLMGEASARPQHCIEAPQRQH
jgi:hypothetical protein